MSVSVNSKIEELKPTIAALQALGCQLVSVQDQGAAGFIAAFRKEESKFAIVKDRGFWHLHGEDERLQRSPSRKSRHQVTSDAIAWLEKHA